MRREQEDWEFVFKAGSFFTYYGAGKHKIGSIDPFNPYEKITPLNKLSMNVKE